jgi:holo-[acyl-carrier protein] synthase
MLECGIDVVDLDQVSRWVRGYDEDALGLVFTGGELRRAGASARRSRELAVCLGAKEAVVKALGTGFRGVAWTDVDTEVGAAGMTIRLREAAGRLARAKGLSRWHGSWTVMGNVVLVAVLAEP